MRKLVPLLFLASLFPLSGCIAVAAVGAAASVGAVQFDRNKVHRDFEEPFDDVWTAARTAIEGLQYAPKGVEVKGLTKTEGELRSEELWIRVEKHPEGYVCVAVRMGTFRTKDHKRRATLYLDEVARVLEGGEAYGSISFIDGPGQSVKVESAPAQEPLVAGR